jgi:hypothetical protein
MVSGVSPRRPAPAGIDPEDAAFIDAKRAEGVGDNQIAKMLGCTAKRVKAHVTGALPSDDRHD